MEQKIMFIDGNVSVEQIKNHVVTHALRSKAVPAIIGMKS